MTKLNLILLLIGICLMLAAMAIGPTAIDPVRMLAALAGEGDEAHVLIMRDIRAPRAVAAFVVGGALAGSGAALQGLLRNPLAEPGVLGVSASSMFGATLALAFLPFAATVLVPLAAIAGGLAATGLIAAVALKVRSVPTLILCGIGLSSFIGALMSLMLSLAPTPFTLAEMVNWSFGTVENRSWSDLLIAGPFLALGALLTWSSRRGHTALALGEDTAASLGLDLGGHRLLTVIGTGMMTGAAVSIAGGIGFIGIVAPHLIRPLTRHDPGASILPSFLAGGCLLLAADILLRIVPGGEDLRLGVLAALIGAPAFVSIVLRRQGSLR